MKPEDIADLKQLIEFLKENQVAEFDLDRGDLKIRLKFNSTGLGDLTRLLGSAPPTVERAAAAATQSDVAATPISAPVEPESNLHTIKSPMVGTFFSSPSPGTAPFVSVGDRVAKGQVIGIVEAMKLMNEIESDAAGEVVKCLISNGQPIEYGQPLFAVRLG
jgi:acetyl-CoA carboxylase biotin carboxyl carrier protein